MRKELYREESEREREAEKKHPRREDVRRFVERISQDRFHEQKRARRALAYIRKQVRLESGRENLAIFAVALDMNESGSAGWTGKNEPRIASSDSTLAYTVPHNSSFDRDAKTKLLHTARTNRKLGYSTRENV